VEVESIAEGRGRSGFGASTAAKPLHVVTHSNRSAVGHEGVEVGITVPF
jgi:hypothetical protein